MSTALRRDSSDPTRPARSSGRPTGRQTPAVPTPLGKVLVPVVLVLITHSICAYNELSCLSFRVSDLPRMMVPRSPEKQKSLVESTFMQRPGHPMDIANAVLFLASELSSWVSGQVLSVDGGSR